ncbi:MAG: 6-phosphogluconolactonase [Spirochaetaceae bacterium]
MTVVSKPRARAEAQAAAILRERLADRIDRAGGATLGVPGGRSVAGVLERLAASDALFDAVDLFFVDERCVPLESEESNYRVVRDALLDPLAARRAAPPQHRIHPFVCAEDDADLGTGAYEEEFRRVATHLDAALLGVGEDGHIASLFPGRPELAEGSRLFVGVENAPKPPPRRMSASPALLTMPDTTVVLLFFGEGKKRALKAFVAKEGSPQECPARLVTGVPDLWVFTDIGA